MFVGVPGQQQGMQSMGMPNTSQDNSMLRNTLQQPVNNRPPMSSCGPMGNNSMGQQQMSQQQSGQSQLESLLKKNTHDLDPNELARAAEIRHMVPTVDSLASSNPNSMANSGHTVMTQAPTTSQNQMSTANMMQQQQQQHHLSMANNNTNNGMVHMNGPTGNNSMQQHHQNNMIKTEDNKMELKTEMKPEPMDNNQQLNQPIKSEPMDVPTSMSQQQPDIKQEDIKPEIKKEPDDNGPTSATTPAKTEPVKSEADTKPAPPPIKIEKVTFSMEQLRDALLPPLEKMWACEPESGPFRTPVDPNALGIPDYFDIIRTPMDMSSIRRKLETGTYKVYLNSMLKIHKIVDNKKQD